jgi:subtilase family serine protease
LLPGVIDSANKGSTTYRNGPDVSANANFTFYVCANQTCTANEVGGTSFAAPMWAGYMALVNQQAADTGHATLGFTNPEIYAVGVGSSYNAAFHDIASGISGSYSAVTGYDLVTGWGSPNGSGLMSPLADMPTPPGFTVSVSPASVSIAQGAKGTSAITTTVSGGFDSAISLSAAGQPAGVTVTFLPASSGAPGSSAETMTMAVSSTTAAGKYTITVTAAGGGLAHTTTVALTVTVAPAFAISASPVSVSVAQGAKGTAMIAATVSGGFDSAISLSAAGQPKGVTVTFSPTSIAAPGAGASTMTMAVASTAAVGTYTITVTAAGGGVTHTTAVALTVLR